MGCSQSTVAVRISLGDIMVIQAEVKKAVRLNPPLRRALHRVTALHRADKEQDLSLEEIAAYVVNDERVLAQLFADDPGVPAVGSVKSNMETFEKLCFDAVQHRVRPRVAVNDEQSKENEVKDDKMLSTAVKEALLNATRTAIVNEVLDLMTPAYHYEPLPEPPRSEARELPPADGQPAASAEAGAVPAPQQQQPSETTTSSSDANAQPAADSTSAAPPPTAAAGGDAQPQQQDTKPQPEPAQQQQQQKDASPPPTAAAAASEPPAAAAPALRYPLPDGSWVQCEDNTDFWWGEAAGLFYYPAAGHFMDPETGMWYIDTEERWLTEEEHEHFLAEMTQRGEY